MFVDLKWGGLAVLALACTLARGADDAVKTDVDFDGLRIDDANHPAAYDGPAIFENFSSKNTSPAYVEKFPYKITEEVVLRNVKVVRD